jgi:chorismate mutase/prephenate dehydratase
MEEYRGQIDKIDAELLRLFKERMEVVKQIAQYKKAHGIPVLDAAREREKLAAIDCPYAQKLYAALFEISRGYQGSEA